MSDNGNLFVGLMSGTSMDAVDAVLVEIKDQNFSIVEYCQFPIPASMQKAVREINSASPIDYVTELDVRIGELFADSVKELLLKCDIKPSKICAIGSHGQTILHLPEENKARTLQIGDPNIIAHQTGITTVADFRRMDMAAGGQGAPLACAFHACFFRDREINRVVLNIGGMANVTILPADPTRKITGFDTGPGNALMDDWTQRHLEKDYDENGEWASSGRYSQDLLDVLLHEPYFDSPPPKSTGKDEFNMTWLDKKIAVCDQDFSVDEVQATLLELTSRTISNAISHFAENTDEILVCGGGIHNIQTMKRLSDLLPTINIYSTAKYGLNPDAVEAITFAWLAKRRLDRIPANLPSVTGAHNSQVLGAVYQPSS